MKEKIKQHFDLLFNEAPKTRKALDLKQEMIQNAMDKYDDLIADGNSERDAYQNVIDSIGDVHELFPELEEKNLFTLPEKDRKKKAMLTAVAVGLYIFAGAVFFSFGLIDNTSLGYYLDFSNLGLVIAMLICIAPTIMLVYAANMYPDYTKKDNDNMVEKYKEVRYSSNRQKAVKRSISSIIWTLAVVLYFVISFTTYDWHITWIIFLIALCIQSIIGLIFTLKDDGSRL